MREGGRPHLRLLSLLLLGVAAIILLVVVLESANITHIFDRPNMGTSTIPAKISTDAESDNKSSSDKSATFDTTGQANQAAPSDKTSAPPSGGAELASPTGSFASNHHPSLEEIDDASGEESVCVTTPGASCTITFTKDGIVKTLGSKKVDVTGTVIWKWDVKTAGFTVGTWEIVATATLDGQTRSTTDLQKLEVQP